MVTRVDDLVHLLDRDNPARVPKFDPARDLAPVALSAWAPPVDQLMGVVDRTAAAGFAYLDAGRPATEQDLLDLADLLALCEPLAPPVHGPINPAAPTREGPDSRAGGATDAGSPAARSSLLQGWHADTAGSRTSMLLCVHSAPSPGPLRLFNATAALVEVARRDPAAAAALIAPETAQSESTSAQPPFAVLDGHLLTRGSPTQAGEWAASRADSPAARRGLAMLDQLATHGSPYRIELPMSAGQGAVLAGARVWYAETAPTARVMLHGLFAFDLVIAGR